MRAIDLCAGSGWSVACRRLGIDELGIEIMSEAIATRDALGLATMNVSIADLPDDFCAQAPLQIAGPPCQTFSMAGSGEGRAALDEVLRRVLVLQETGELIRGGAGDPRTWLVLEPLRLAVGGMPQFIAWEQVPVVLPVWEACAAVLRSVGYSTWTGILNAEQYGVPQTRKRAFLIARRDGQQAGPPVPTHSRYHNRTPARLDDGMVKWVSMAEALGWGPAGRPAATGHGGGTDTGGAEPINQWNRFQAQNAESWVYVNGTGVNAGRRTADQPAPTVHFGARSNGVSWTETRPATTVQGDPRIAEPGHRDRAGGEPQFGPASIRVSVQEAAMLQTFPPDHPFAGAKGKQYLQIGNAVPPLLGEAVLRTFV